MRRIGIAAAFAAVLIGAHASGAILEFRADLDGQQEVPANASPGIGFLEATLDDVTGFVTVTAGSYSDLLANSTSAHIHGPGAPGVNAGVVLPLSGPFGGLSGNLSGSGTLAQLGFTTQELIDEMNAGNMYVNVHSTQFPGGEIRGQLYEVPEPTTAALFGVGLAGILRRRRL